MTEQSNTLTKDMINGKSIRYNADVIARYKGNYIVIIKRLKAPLGLALPGGGQECGEKLSAAAKREFKEETGLDFTMTGVAETITNHDPRQDRHSISTVFYGFASGKPQNEEGKTEVLLLTYQEIMDRSREFVFDHDLVLKRYFANLFKS